MSTPNDKNPAIINDDMVDSVAYFTEMLRNKINEKPVPIVRFNIHEDDMKDIFVSQEGMSDWIKKGNEMLDKVLSNADKKD